MAKRPSESEIDKARWRAVLARAALPHDGFVYCVRSTGVYCRPTCPSRRPGRGAVVFHADWGAAEAAGFRACLRCRPKDAEAADASLARVERACRRMDRDDEFPSLGELAREAGLSASHFQRVFKSVTGLSPKAYAAGRRAERMRVELAQGAESVADAVYASGFGASSRFYANMKETLGMRAAIYRKGGEGADIRFAVGGCALGAVLAARSETGVCAIFLGDDPQALAGELRKRFPRARIVEGDPGEDALLARAVSVVEAGGSCVELPLDLRGTAFQLRVWRALSKIPYGETATYAEVAQRIGAPKAVRAVASACAANTVAVAVPCHRVVRSDGGLSGYRWGAARKKRLLARERGEE